jgi:hypothetical protein
MVSTWIESAAKGRLGGPVRAGMWSTVVIGTHPIEANQDVWLELQADDVTLGPLPAYWTENKGVNSLWHVPIPPQAVGVRLHYRSSARHNRSEPVYSGYQDAIVRPNLPERTESAEVVGFGPEAIVGNRMMTVRIDARGSTYDVYYPTVGLHSDVRPAAGDMPQGRSHFRAIVGGLAVGRRLDWFTERNSWDAFQHYQGATNLLMTELTSRNGSIRVLITDCAAMGGCLPKTSGGTESPGQYVKRFRVKNDAKESRQALFGVYIQAEVNGGIGEPGLSWHDDDRTLLAINRGHAHVNRKLARDATVEFAIALDANGEVHCEPTGPNEAILLRLLDLPAGETVTVDLIVSGAFTGWRGDPGTFEHWLKPALAWFRSVDLDQVEQCTAREWDEFVEPVPTVQFPRSNYAVALRRSALAMGLHADAAWGAIASGFDRGLNAYCWPREAIWVGAAFDRIGHSSIGRKVYHWLSKVRGQNRPYSYWCHKYTINGFPEWESPAVDQTAMIPWGLERHYQRTGDLDIVTTSWPMIEQAAGVACGNSGHPGLRWIEHLHLISSVGLWDQRYAAFLYSNACVVAGLRAAARLAERLDKTELAKRWRSTADEVWEIGILTSSRAGQSAAPGLIDADSGQFLDARRLSTQRGLWTDNPELLIERTTGLDVSMLGLVLPLELLPASDPRVVRSAETILRTSVVNGDPNALSRWSLQDGRLDRRVNDVHTMDVSSLATLWMVRYLIQLGRETGQARHWNRALDMLDALLTRLLPLGLSIRTSPRPGDQAQRLASTNTSSGCWALHSMLVESILDFAGLDYQALNRRLTIDPALPSAWPQTGQTQIFSCGEVSYRLERPIGGTVHQLTLKARLDHPVTFQVGITCPGLREIGPWQSTPDQPPPEFNRRIGRLTWSGELPAGESELSWTWG